MPTVGGGYGRGAGGVSVLRFPSQGPSDSTVAPVIRTSSPPPSSQSPVSPGLPRPFGRPQASRHPASNPAGQLQLGHPSSALPQPQRSPHPKVSRSSADSSSSSSLGERFRYVFQE